MRPLEQYIGGASVMLQCTADLFFQIAGDDRLLVMITGLYRTDLDITLTIGRVTSIAVERVLIAVFGIAIFGTTGGENIPGHNRSAFIHQKA